MSFSAPSAPPPPPTPNPYSVAAAQTSSNISTAIANAKLQNADEETPEAYIAYTEFGSYDLDDPQYSSSGTLASTTTRTIPLFKRTITFKAPAQAIFDKNQEAKLTMASLTASQLSQLQTALGNPFSTASLPAAADAPAAQLFTMSVSDPGSLVRTIGSTSLVTHIESVRNAILYRPNLKIDWDRQQLVTKLANQGIIPGMDAYDREMQIFAWRENDEQNAAYLKAMEEQSRIINLEALIATFANDATRRVLDNSILIGEFANKAAVQRFAMLHTIADFTNTFRARRMQELLSERSVPLNEISALLHGSQVSVPQFEGFRPGHVSDTPIGQYIYQSAALDMQKYQSVVQQQQWRTQRRDEMIGGMLGAAGGMGAAMIDTPPESFGRI